MAIPDSWIEYQRPLPGGGTFTQLRPGSAVKSPDEELTVTRGRGKRLVRVGTMTLALNSDEHKNFPNLE